MMARFWHLEGVKMRICVCDWISNRLSIRRFGQHALLRHVTRTISVEASGGKAGTSISCIFHRSLRTP